MTNKQPIIEKIIWQVATVTNIKQETERVKTFTLSLPIWQEHLPGQHYDVRLTAADGYQAQRSYSVASSGVRSGEIDLTVDRIHNGEISTYLHQSVVVGDPIEVRGPIGGYFVWSPAIRDLPLLLIGGGSGIVPLMSMLRHRSAIKASNPTVLLVSVRSEFDLIYRTEIEHMANSTTGIVVAITYTRQIPKGWLKYQRRIDSAMLKEILANFSETPQCFVCGPTGLVERVATDLVNSGVPDKSIRTERFG